MFSTGSLTILLIFSIPLLAILLGGVKEIFEVRAKQNKLGTSTEELESKLTAITERLSAVEDERDALQKRVQNLETIVTADAWDEPGRLSEPSADLDVETDAEAAQDTAQDAERIARRLRSR